MADTELVIKIPEEEYKRWKEDGEIDAVIVRDALINGMSLPKGHGKLIARSKIPKPIPAEEDNCTGMGMTYDEMDAYNNGIDAMYALVRGAKPIIEADKESENG